MVHWRVASPPATVHRHGSWWTDPSEEGGRKEEEAGPSHRTRPLGRPSERVRRLRLLARLARPAGDGSVGP